ncbi:GH39 family glycosyl hydrolase [Alkalibaculum sporogenes]|nr:helix-turn-helix domain-containing protein [Alkalibaculum sporogenes]
MATSHEIINYPENIPMTLFINSIGSVGKHWHKSIELLIVIEGIVSLVVGGEQIKLGVDDIFLVNSNEIHDLNSENATLIAIQIKLEMSRNVPAEFENTHYRCDSSQDTNTARYKNIKQIVARFLKLNLDGGKYIELMNESLFYNLIYELYANFSDGKLIHQDGAFKQLNRLNEILAIINSEYHTKLSLQSIAARVHVTPPYLSKFFKESMGISLSEHIKAIRLRYALNDLLYLDYSIDTIGQNNGFPNSRAFVSAFKEKYNMLPSTWRTQNSKRGIVFTPTNKDKSINYYETDSVTMHRALLKFINTHITSTNSVTPVDQTAEYTYQIQTDDVIINTITEKRFMGVSRAKELLYQPVREQLVEVQQKMHFDYIKMHSIFEDGLYVYSETKDGKPIYNFNLVDQILDFLVSIHLKPLLQLSFMPYALASVKNRRMFSDNIIVSEPEDINKWNSLVWNFTTHIIERYSLTVVRTWLFSVWNEPGTANQMFGFNTDEIYYNLYKSSYDTVKSISEDLCFGGPAAFSAYGKNDDWLINFLKYATENECKPDFVSIHYYDIDLSDNFFMNKIYDNELWLSSNNHSFSLYLDQLHPQLDSTGYSDVPLYITEWNSTTSHKDPLSDTCFKSSYVVKNILDVIGKTNGICYWLLTDLHEENLLSPNTFHGGLGMYTFNNIKKPVYYALDFLYRLETEIIYSNDGIVVSSTNDGYKILLYNYHHFSSTYAKDFGINTSYTDRYSVFPNKGKSTVSIQFPELKGTYCVVQEYVNCQNGSSFDNFVKMGAIEPLSLVETEYLRNISVPGISKSIAEFPDNQLSITMMPFEIRLITLKKKYNLTS